ncbi:MAG: hypothetical protein L0I80_03975, partial [Brevibacterium sp.]|nr:hypothetical protein [Brevibacterium sp.]
EDDPQGRLDEVAPTLVVIDDLGHASSGATLLTLISTSVDYYVSQHTYTTLQRCTHVLPFHSR